MFTSHPCYKKSEILEKILTADALEKLVEILVVLVVKGDGLLSSLSVDLNAAAKVRLNAKSHFLEVINDRKILFLGLGLYRFVDLLYLVLKLTYGEIKLYGALCKKYKIIGILNTEKGSTVTCGKLAGCYHFKNGGREIEKSCCVSNCGTALAYALGKLLLSKAILGCESLECHSLFNGVEVFALDVFYKGDFGNLSIVAVKNYCRDLGKSGNLRSTEAALTGNDLVTAVCIFANENGLKKSVFFNGFSKLGKGILVKYLSGLIALRIDHRNGELGYLIFGALAGVFKRIVEENCIKTSTKSAILLSGHVFLPPDFV